MVIVRVSAHYSPHPKVFDMVASHLGGKVIELCPSKFSDITTTCLCAIPKDQLAFLEELQPDPFSFGPTEIWSLQILSTPRV